MPSSVYRKTHTEHKALEIRFSVCRFEEWKPKEHLHCNTVIKIHKIAQAWIVVYLTRMQWFVKPADCIFYFIFSCTMRMKCNLLRLRIKHPTSIVQWHRNQSSQFKIQSSFLCKFSFIPKINRGSKTSIQTQVRQALKILPQLVSEISQVWNEKLMEFASGEKNQPWIAWQETAAVKHDDYHFSNILPTKSFMDHKYM